jgi:cell division protease FtsH
VTLRTTVEKEAILRATQWRERPAAICRRFDDQRSLYEGATVPNMKLAFMGLRWLLMTQPVGFHCMDTPERPEPNDPKPQGRKGGERRAPPVGGNALWYVIAFSVPALLLAMWFNMGRGYDIGYLQFEELLEKMAKEPDPAKRAEVKITIEHEDGAGKRAYRYWNPTNIIVGQEQITGEIKRQPIDARANDIVKPEPFRVEARGFRSAQNDRRIAELLTQAGIKDARSESAPSIWKNWAPTLVMTVLFVVVFFFLLRRLGGAGSPMAFGRSRGRLWAQEDIGVTFNDVAGIDEAVDEVKEVVEFLRTPEKYQSLGGRIPKGVLLVGPPGTGKTLLAKAIAGEAGVPFFSLSGSDFVEMFVGVGAARVRDMFQQAESRAPCIIFIDELDALGKTRGTSIVGGHDEREQTLNALLVEMDGFDTNSGTIVVAATNRPETLDPALLRPGRFDRTVLVDRPDIRGREQILKVHIKDVKLGEEVDLKEIARITPGFVGADLANLVNEGALLAARKGKKAVGMDEFNEGVERVIAGLEKKQRVMRPDEKQRIAYHESGHALVAYSLPNTDPVHKVSIIPRGYGALGYTMHRPEDDRYLVTQSELESRIQVLMAGTIAEELIYNDVSTGAQNDLERASEIARSIVMEYGMSRLGRVNYRESKRSPFLAPAPYDYDGRQHSEQTMREIDEEVTRIIDEAVEKVRNILRVRRQALEALTTRLIEKETIGADELKEVIDANSTSPLIVPGTEAEPKRVVSELGRGVEPGQAEASG